MEEKRKKHNINNVFYAVIGVATLMVAIMGATFAYFTATASNNTLTGNMATIDFDLAVSKVTDADDAKGGLIPMSNNMMEQALTSSKGICIDDNGNAVCQVYKIEVANTSSSSMFLDGYVTLNGGSGVPEDVTTDFNYASEGTQTTAGYPATTMRWAQAFCTAESAGGKVTACSTGNNNGAYSTLRTDAGETAVSIASLGGTSTKNDGKNLAEIKYKHEDVTGTTKINGNTYTVINSNYIRLSKHTLDSYSYTKSKTGTYSNTVHDDTTSALVYNQYLKADDNNDTNNTGTSASTFTDAQVYYIVVWLSENGHNQTAVTGATGAATSTANFYHGNVTFITAQGTEVTATFSGHTKVTPNT